MERVRSTYLHLTYREQSTTFEQVTKHFELYSDIFVFCSMFKMNVVLYRENRFDIKTENYIRKNFKIGKTLPEVKPTTKTESVKILDKHLMEKRQIVTKGLFKELFDEYTCRLEEEKKDREIERLQAELKERTMTTVNITNVMIPQIYKGMKMNPLGKEDLSRYTLDDLLTIVKRNDSLYLTEGDYADIFRRMIELIHYDERCPENHNIHITVRDKSKPECTVFTDSGWHLCMELETVISTLCATNKEFITQIYNRQQKDCDALDDEMSRKLRSIYERMKYYISNHTPFKVTEALYSLTKTKIPQLKN